MPFVGELSDERVIPEEISDKTDVCCPECGDIMRPRGPFSDGTARHFYHLNDTESCSGGESDTHRKLKSLAVSALRTNLEEEVEEVGPERSLNVSDTASSVTNRRADALARFKEPHDIFGKGIAVEVQYRNKGKDIKATTHDYLRQGISVYWATVDDFHQDQFEIERLKDAFKQDGFSTVAFSAVHDTAPPVTQNELFQSGSQGTESKSESWTPHDPAPGCRHEFIKGESSEYCLRCGLDMELRAYSEELERYLKPRSAPSNLEVRYVFDRHSTEKDYEPPQITDNGVPPQHYHDWHRYSEVWTHDKYQCSCGADMTVGEEKVVINHGRSNQEATCNHKWEMRGSSKICAKCGEERKPWDESR
ncbi:Competence CoiA family protein [Halorhabdus tiamatea SARL4B]|uniref:Competence CoiA family protein n=1 Tax=Halorhabdus tiamatea SARL4B TaxID=1033806 RepID=U2FGS4_9EURY|nr:hypothetical protein [Halorhabdus tiamatea]ERJ07424.1 Competence CoiA family protein [Halorhabdus tiamatea SARL4B]